MELSERLSMVDQIPTGMGPALIPRTSPVSVGNTHEDMTPRTSPAGIRTPRGSILQEFLETLDQRFVPTPSPNALLTELQSGSKHFGTLVKFWAKSRECTVHASIVI